MSHESGRRWCVSLAVLVAVLGTPLAARADEAKVNVAAGYAWMHDYEASEHFPAGWFVSAAGRVSPMLEVVGEVSGNYKTLSVLGTDVSLSVHTFMGGPRVFARHGQLTPYVQVLVGAARQAGSVVGVGASETNFAVQPGGGVDAQVSKMIGLRFGGNWRFIRSSDETTKEFQFVAGVVIGR